MDLIAHRQIDLPIVSPRREPGVRRETPRAPSGWRFAAILLLATLAALHAGCATPGEADASRSTAETEAPDEPVSEEGEGGEQGDVAESIQSHAQRLAEAVERSSLPSDDGDGDRAGSARVEPSRGTAADVRVSQPSPTGEAPTDEAPAGSSEVEPEPEAESEVTATDEGDEAQKEAASPSALSRDELVRRLMQRVRGEEEPAMQRALTAATLSAALGETLDLSVLGPLDHTQRGAVERYHRLVSAMMGDVAMRGGALDRDALHDQVDALFAPEPIEIKRLELCRSVASYGVYEPYADHVFLAGGERRMLVYVELEHFRARQTDGGRYEVRLRQEVVLYNESDGLAVWRQDPVAIEDISRNERRDFFVVQMIRLPARLSVGKYRLKVRVTDENGGSIDETTTPIELVADERLTGDDK